MVELSQNGEPLFGKFIEDDEAEEGMANTQEEKQVEESLV